jgi:prepilin-type N-terminal cleavage/methylation domain-containing protein
MAFTLVELMIVVVIVAILALVAIPLYQGNVAQARFSEGIAGVGTIRTSLRVYAASHGGDYPTIPADTTADELAGYGLTVGDEDLVGKYFGNADYTVVSTSTTYTVAATMDGQTYSVDQDGDETGDITFNQ